MYHVSLPAVLVIVYQKWTMKILCRVCTRSTAKSCMEDFYPFIYSDTLIKVFTLVSSTQIPTHWVSLITEYVSYLEMQLRLYFY